MQLRSLSVILLAPVILMLSPFALAHTGAGHTAGLADGFMHPLTGLDHLLIAIAAGFWAGRSGDHGVTGMVYFLSLLLGGVAAGQLLCAVSAAATVDHRRGIADGGVYCGKYCGTAVFCLYLLWRFCGLSWYCPHAGDAGTGRGHELCHWPVVFNMAVTDVRSHPAAGGGNP